MPVGHLVLVQVAEDELIKANPVSSNTFLTGGLRADELRKLKEFCLKEEGGDAAGMYVPGMAGITQYVNKETQKKLKNAAGKLYGKYCNTKKLHDVDIMFRGRTK